MSTENALLRVQKQIIFAALLWAQVITNAPVASAEAESDTLKASASSVSADALALDAITRQILKKEIELDTLNQKFRLNTALTTKWRQRRVFLYSEANSCLTLSSLLQAIPMRYKIITAKTATASDNIRRKDRGKFACATEVQLIGQSVSLGGDVIELGLNFNNYLKLKREHLDPKSYRQQAEVLEGEIDSAIAQRTKLLAESSNFTGADLKAAQLEGQLINDYRNITLNTYANYHSATKRFWVLQNTSFLVDMSKNGAGMTGNLIGLTGNHWRRPRMQGGSGVMSLISGVIVLATPAVGRITSNVSAVAARRLVTKKMQNLEAINGEILERHRHELLNLVAENGTDAHGYLKIANSRINVFAKEEKMLYDMEKGVARDRKLAKDNLIENIAFAAAVAPPRMANGITQIIGGWNYYDDHRNANRLYFGGNTAYLVGTGINIFETGRIEFNAERRFHDQAKNHSSTRERIGERIKTLDEIKSSI